MNLSSISFHGPRPPQLEWSALTHVGRVRKNNEDAFLGIVFDGHEVHHLGKVGRASLATTDFVFAVSDGMGGAKSGEFASRIAVDRLARLMPRAFRMSATGMDSGFTDVLSELILSIHADLIQLGTAYEECAGMGATLSLAWFTPEWMYFGHVGDSRIYYLPKAGGLIQLTHDHSHVGWLRREGKINEREARTHPRRNALQQVLGAGHQFVEPHIGATRHAVGDRFLICSDGLIDGLWDRQIEELVRAPAPADTTLSPAERIVEEAVRNSGRDNVTAVLVQITPPVPRHVAPGSTLLFVYGTLKRGCSNHRYLAGQKFVGLARTVPGYSLYDLGGYPGLVAHADARDGVVGEVWSVDEAGLRELDRFEGVHEGLYRREPISLQPPFDERPVDAYVSVLPVTGRPHVGSEWIE